MDKRLLRVGVSIHGVIKYYDSADGMRIYARGLKAANALESSADVTITGLNKETRDYLITETSPFLDNREPVFCILEAGRESSGLFKLFEGYVSTIRVGLPPDLDVTLTINSGYLINTEVKSFSVPGDAPLKTIAQRVASEIGKTLVFNAANKTIKNFYHTGGGMGLVRALAGCGVLAYIDDSELVVQDKTSAREDRIKILNKDSGMVGLPMLTEVGCDVAYLIDGESVLGGYIQIQSQHNPAADGNYRVDNLAFDVASHGDQFFYTAQGVRLK